MRPHKPYNAPADAADKVRAICGSLQISNKPDYQLKSLEEKFKFLEACFADFKHSVPNSQIYEIKTVGMYTFTMGRQRKCNSITESSLFSLGDVIKFYETSVNTTVPLDALKTMELPENLHIQYDYLRFNSETDTKFNGQTAFPKSSTLVTGLKYRGKYVGNEAKQSWP